MASIVQPQHQTGCTVSVVLRVNQYVLATKLIGVATEGIILRLNHHSCASARQVTVEPARRHFLTTDYLVWSGRNPLQVRAGKFSHRRVSSPMLVLVLYYCARELLRCIVVGRAAGLPFDPTDLRGRIRLLKCDNTNVRDCSWPPRGPTPKHHPGFPYLEVEVCMIGREMHEIAGENSVLS